MKPITPQETIQLALAIIQTRVDMIIEQIGKIDPDYELIEKSRQAIHTNIQYIKHKTQNNEQTTAVGQRKPNDTRSSSTTTTNETI